MKKNFSCVFFRVHTYKLTLIICAWLIFFVTNPAFSLQAEHAKTVSAKVQKNKRLLFLPLDERFTTRDLFLENAKITSFKVLTPGQSLLPRQKNLPDVNSLMSWTEKNAKSSDVGIISAEMFLYGGLIASRISDDSLEISQKRLAVLEKIHRANPNLRLLVSATVTRIPNASDSGEEPEYYAKYGREIFQFSYLTHRYETLKNPADKVSADNFKNKIPPHILEDFLNRRRRNFSINKELIKLVAKKIISRLVITLDDNSEYGFSKKEAAELEKLAAPFKDRIAIYPGADEAQLALLSNLRAAENPVSVYPVYRFPQSKKLIPSFEGSPLEESVRQQIRAAGGFVAENLSKAECILYVNNFAEKNLFPPKNRIELPENTAPLEDWLKRAGIGSIENKVLILADNRFYNGADTELISAILKSKINPEQLAYAGWNTSGNTLGSAISFGILRRKMPENDDNFWQFKKMLFTRFLEDWVYMTIGRNQINNDLQKRSLTQFAATKLETQYEREMKRLFDSRAPVINSFLQSDYQVTRTFFPWHRPFEIGFEVQRRDSD